MRAQVCRTAAPRRALALLSETCADGGIQRFNRTFLSALDQLNIGCNVLSLGDSEVSRSRWPAPPLVSMRVFNRNKVRFSLAACVAILRGDYDLLIVGHINLLELAAAVVACRPGLRARVMLVAHGIEVWTGMESMRRKAAMAAIDRILSVSRYTRARLRAQMPRLTDDRFIIFPNALSETWAQHAASQQAPDWEVAPAGRFFLSVTRLDRGERYKGLVTAFESFAMLADRAVRYVVAGRGDDLEFLREVVARIGISDRVQFVGGLSDAELVSLYRRCAAFVLPSGKEGFGIVFLEAMFFGAPVIAACEKGSVDVVRDEDNGLLVPYGDTVRLCAAMERVLNDAALRERLRTAGRACVVGSGTFTFQAYVQRLANAFE